jgi:nitrate reductase NapE component
MGYLFLSEPLMLYFDGKKQEAVTFFFTTVGTFAIITAAFVAALFFLV